jgi:hypothetical protein
MWRSGMAGKAVSAMFLSFASLVAALILATSIGTTLAQTLDSAGKVVFDIPPQPLAPALQEFGKATGLEVFYDGAMSIGRSSAAVKGSYTPMDGLRILLRGTGYMAHATEITNTITIVDAPSVGALRASFDRFQPYFAVLQAHLSEALCNEPAMAGGSVTFRFWLNSSGVVARAEVLGSGVNDNQHRATISKIQGLSIGKAPPPGLPEPLTMVIYPPSAGEVAECPPVDSRRAGN